MTDDERQGRSADPAATLLTGAAAVAALLVTALLDGLLTVPATTLPIWLSAGLGLALLVRLGPVGAVATFVGVAGACLVLQEAWILSLAAAAVATAAAVGGAWVLKRSGAGADFERARDVGVLALAAAAVAAPLLVVGGMAVALAQGGTSAFGLPLVLAAWPWHLVGVLLGAVPVLAYTRPARRMSGTRLWLRHSGPGVLLAALAVASALVWLMGPDTGQVMGLAVAWWPHVLLVALLVQGALTVPAVATLLIGVAAAAATARGAGPFGDWVASGPLQALQAVTGYAGSLVALMLITHAAGEERQLRQRRSSQALAAVGVAVAEWHRWRAGEVHLSSEWLALTRHAERRGWTVDDWLADIHDDDRDRLQAMIEEAEADVRRPSLEIRVQSRDGWHWVEVNVLVSERDQFGRPLRLMATMTEVSERHEAQERQRLSASLFEHLHEGLLIADEHMNVLDANPAYSQILGVPLGSLLGTMPSLLRPNPPDPLLRQQRTAMWNALRAHGRWRGELLERRGQGELCTLNTTISQVHGPEGDLRYHVLAIADITEQREQRERLERQAHFDELTRLPNRTRLGQLLADAMRAADRDGYLLAVCYLDLDRFKPVNDRFGHEGGDHLLVELAGRLRGALRSRDMWADAAARLGGDEFVLLLRAATLEEVRLAIQRVLRVVAEPYVIDSAVDPVQITASIGASIYPIDRSDPDTLLRHADHAMYRAKQAGRNGFLIFDPERRRRNEERVMAIGRVQEALDRAEFVLFYQPIVDMKAGRVLALEALLRWEHPDQGMIPPAEFLPLIEDTGLSARIGDWVLTQALEHLAQWRTAGLEVEVNVNISARHLQEADFVQRLSELLARFVLPLARALKLEIVESAAHADLEATSNVLRRCRDLGVRSALDDFGTGYSTLTHLQRLPIDVLKIDRSFVNHMLDDAQDRALVEGVIGLARTFGCAVVAEGVESPAQARALLDLGCHLGQGIGIAAPMPASQVAAWVRGHTGMFALAPAPMRPAAGDVGSKR